MSSLKQLKDPSITKLGVFDSGLGGLTVLEQLLAVHPAHDYIYFGDTAHVPYGSREAEDVVALVSDIARYLVSEGCQGLILACNTSSALALSALRATVDVPIIGVIETASHEAARLTSGRVVVLANPLTAASGVYRAKVLKEAEVLGREVELEILEIGCPDLVPIVENGWLHTAESAKILAGYAEQIENFGADTLILGCTHYPLLLPVLEPLLGGIKIVNPASLIPDYLHPKTQTASGSVEFRVSGDSPGFDSPASKIMGREVVSASVDVARILQRS